jgi:pilus assembly protein CpaC
MHPKRYVRRTLLWGLVLAAGVIGATAYGQPPAPPTVQIDPKTGAVIVPLGGTVTFDPKGDVPESILVSREDVLGVKVDPANPKLLLLTGRNTGLSKLTLTYKDTPKKEFDVIVQPDLALLRNLIRRTVPTAAVEVNPGLGNVIILSGYVTSPQDADIVTRLVQNAAGGGAGNVINALQVGGGQMVQIDVVVASVDRTALRNRGFDFFVGGTQASFASILNNFITGTLVGGGGGTPGGTTTTVSSAANLQLGIVGIPFVGALRALRTENIAKFIAEPRVVTQSGRPAFFRAGGQQAILSTTSGITGPGVQLVPFGTELEVCPIVYANGQIWLEINPRITAVSQGLGIVVGGAASPGFTEQSVRTAVMLESGQTYAIGGLIQNSVQASAAKVPVLGDLPFIGFGFSSVQHQQVESELVILVTPRLVGPMNCDQVPKRLPGRETRSPDDYELFLEGILEAPRGQRKVWVNRCYNAAWKCDPTAALFPCIGNVCTGPGGIGVVGGACGPVGGPVVPVPAPHGPVPSTLPPAAPPSPGGGSAEAPPPIVVVPQVPGN